jgi:DNA-directed RNA polymerase subunit RPC12/RpoP
MKTSCVVCGKPVNVRTKQSGPLFAVCHSCGVKEFNKPIRQPIKEVKA